MDPLYRSERPKYEAPAKKKGLTVTIKKIEGNYFLVLHNDRKTDLRSLVVQLAEQFRANTNGFHIDSYRKNEPIKVFNLKAGDEIMRPIKLSGFGKHFGNLFTGVCLVRYVGRTAGGRKIEKEFMRLSSCSNGGPFYVAKSTSFPATFNGFGKAIGHLAKQVKKAFRKSLRPTDHRRGARDQIAANFDKH